MTCARRARPGSTWSTPTARAGEIENAIERADREAFTKESPKALKGQIGFLIKQFGSAKAVAQEIGVTADSVNRYRRGARKHARADVAAKIDDAVRQRWQPLVRKRRQKQAATSTGITVETRARFGYTAPVGTTDDGRFRSLTVHLPPQYAQRLFDARDAGATDQQMRGIIAEGFKEVYFQDGGARAMGLSDVEINDIDYLDLDY
ncbi:telomere-protecting terminal protein Tpg [Streptomyces sp. A012304]|uniref:telomere-protecting terminal protein Tpg n=1 Tax=Streptomyces sp. A012304 TaxID=375446 RepID=UPI00222FC1D7|nr:XRE family transcriptional regulator [Streptomyces sp. A012304]GKQ38510.1 hypothetical protein ALMP_50410 [Streptomyces sp. A012304]